MIYFMVKVSDWHWQQELEEHGTYLWNGIMIIINNYVTNRRRLRTISIVDNVKSMKSRLSVTITKLCWKYRNYCHNINGSSERINSISFFYTTLYLFIQVIYLH